MDPVNDRVTQAIVAALDGVSARQGVIAHNIANASTPGYRAQRLQFEEALAAAIASGDPSRARTSTVMADTPVKQDGNSVDMTKEVTALSEAGLQYSALVSALNFKVSVVRSALAR